MNDITSTITKPLAVLGREWQRLYERSKFCFMEWQRCKAGYSDLVLRGTNGAADTLAEDEAETLKDTRRNL